jgi:hypothetical protein
MVMRKGAATRSEPVREGRDPAARNLSFPKRAGEAAHAVCGAAQVGISEKSPRVHIIATSWLLSRHGTPVRSPVMSPSLVVADCPECRAVGSVLFGTCEVCFSEFSEDPHETVSHGDDAPLSTSGPGLIADPAASLRRG